MNTKWKQTLIVAIALACPAVVLAANHVGTKEHSNHVTNKKAIAMEAKEDKLTPPAVRDWAAIDTDKDHSISPEEMEKFLNEVWNAKRKG